MFSARLEKNRGLHRTAKVGRFLPLKFKKKALVESTLVKIILLIVSCILLFVFIYEFYSKATERIDEKACHDAIVLTQVLAEKTHTTSVKPWPAICKTKDNIIKTNDPEKAKKELAEMMAWCWWMVGEGVIKPFDKDYFYGGRKCFVCYTAQFPDLKEPISKEDFLFYLQDKGREGTKYYDYLKYGEEKVIDSPLADPIDNKKVYAVVYSNPRDPTLQAIGTCFGVAGAGILGGAATGATVAGAAGTLGGPVGTAAGIIIGGTVGSIVGGVGTVIGCGVATVNEWLKEDLVYVADVNHGSAGCYGTWYAPVEEVQTS